MATAAKSGRPVKRAVTHWSVSDRRGTFGRTWTGFISHSWTPILRDVEGLVNLIDNEKLAANDLRLTLRRDVGVQQGEDENFEFERHASNRSSDRLSAGLNAEPVRLAATIKHDEG